MVRSHIDLESLEWAEKAALAVFADGLDVEAKWANGQASSRERSDAQQMLDRAIERLRKLRSAA